MYLLIFSFILNGNYNNFHYEQPSLEICQKSLQEFKDNLNKSDYVTVFGMIYSLDCLGPVE